jgi:hypothetical protein
MKAYMKRKLVVRNLKKYIHMLMHTDQNEILKVLQTKQKLSRWCLFEIYGGCQII